MDLPPGSPLSGRVQVGARLLAIDGERTDDLDGVRALVRRLPVGATVSVEFDSGALECELHPLPLEPLTQGRVELGEVDCHAFRLRSIWTFPPGKGPFSAIWLFPSANWLSEEHTQELWHPTLKLVDALTSLGFATLRVDRRGLGDSTGAPCVDADLEEELSWCRRSHAHLLSHPRVDPERVFFFGRSLGGTFVQLLAHELRPRAAAVWGATALPWHEAMMVATRRQRALAGMSGEALDEYMRLRARLSEAVLLRGELPAEVLAREPALLAARGEFEGARVHGRTAAFFQQLQRADVAAACARYQGELLVMRGELDWITSEDDAASVVAAARHPSPVFFPGIDHLMHRRQNLREAFEHTFGGDFDASGAEAMAAFFRRADP